MKDEDDKAAASAEPSARGVRGSVLDYMRKTNRVASAENRSHRPARRMPGALGKPPPSFEELPEYRQVMAHRVAGEQIGMENPFYRAHEAAAGATTRIGGKAMINFASYDYLGLNGHPRVLKDVHAALDRYAVSASASRLVGGERPIHTALEEKLAEIYRVEAAVTFVSGYLTNVAAISALMGPGDLVIHDELIHNSAVTGIRLSGATRRFFVHNDMESLEAILRASAGEYRRVMVIVEGVYSMDGDIADLPALVRLRREYGFWLMLDEAHALGVLGRQGHGTHEHFGCEPADIDIRMGTLSKTTSSCGGYIAGSRALVEILKAQAGGFVYSVGLAPALAAAALSSLETMAAEPERTGRLQANGTYFLRKAREAGLDTGLSEGFSVVPIIVGDSLRAARLSNDLFAEGINVMPIIHPAVAEGQARLRFFITSEHTRQQLKHTVENTRILLKKLEDINFGVGSVDLSALAEFL